MSFIDVSPDDWAKKDIEKVTAAGRMSGYPGGWFKPDQYITRREMASILARQMAWDGSFKDVLPSCLPAVVSLRSENGLGSGFFITEDGYIITNNHVALISTDGTLTVEDSAVPIGKAKIIATNAMHDMALLKLGAVGMPFLTIAAAEVEVGDHVGIIGAPKGYVDSFCQGVVSHVKRVKDPTALEADCFQFDAPANPGNSGGPLINEAGEVVGVDVSKWVAVDTEGLAWAIHARYVREFCRLNGITV